MSRDAPDAVPDSGAGPAQATGHLDNARSEAMDLFGVLRIEKATLGVESGIRTWQHELLRQHLDAERHQDRTQVVQAAHPAEVTG